MKINLGAPFTLATILFVILKIADVKPFVDWSWWLVFAPIWGPVATILVAAIIVFSLIGLMTALDA